MCNLCAVLLPVIEGRGDDEDEDEDEDEDAFDDDEDQFGDFDDMDGPLVSDFASKEH